MTHIYTVTSVNGVFSLEGRSQYDSRCWGYYFDLEVARQAVFKNLGDMYECGYYNYIVIEKTPPGILAGHETEEVQWYAWTFDIGDGVESDFDGWSPVPKPPWSKDVICWGLGG